MQFAIFPRFRISGEMLDSLANGMASLQRLFPQLFASAPAEAQTTWSGCREHR